MIDIKGGPAGAPRRAAIRRPSQYLIISFVLLVGLTLAATGQNGHEVVAPTDPLPSVDAATPEHDRPASAYHRTSR
jgi:hypothetical protein